MLLNLNICNFAVFEKESVSFEHGFNVFTGETGAGKSILIEALFLLLGERATKSLIRKGKKSALIEAVFDVGQNAMVNCILQENGIYVDDNDFLIISREILENGKSINKINNRIVPLNLIKEIGGYLIDIYGQFEHQSLFKKESHVLLLDNLAQSEIKPLLETYGQTYKEYKDKCSEIEFIEKKLVNKDLKIEQLQHELNEIDEADIQKSEEEDLLKEIKKLSNIQEIKNIICEVDICINKGENCAVDYINHAYSLLNKIKNYDENISEFLPKLDLILEELQEFLYDTVDYADNLDLDEERLLFVENRVSLINRLKRKYGYSIDKILEYKQDAENELNMLYEVDSRFKLLTEQKNKLNTLLKSYADKISKARKKAAIYLEKEIIKELHDLNMKNIRFKVNIEEKEEFSPDGKDAVEFMISTNAGSDLNSVQKVVSGGEASRVMLALKKLSSDVDKIDTLVFDEIDTGISGKTSQMAGLKMKYIGEKHQVICITHSPQIASLAENHFVIEKSVVDNNTFSYVKKLGNDKKVYEIARLLSGLNITEKSISNAEELIEISNTL